MRTATEKPCQKLPQSPRRSVKGKGEVLVRVVDGGGIGRDKLGDDAIA